MAVTVVIADDQTMVRQSFRAVLDAQPDIEVVGEAATGAEAVAACRRLRPDLVLMDIRMPELDGLAATRQLLGGDRESGPRVLMLTTFDADEYVYGALGAGASGFLLKDSPLDDLVAAVRMVAAGNALFAPAVTRRVIAGFAGRRPRTQDVTRLAGLTARELEVLRLIAQGLSNVDIAGRLVIAEQTAKTHVSRVLGKLGLRDRAQAVVLAYEAKLVVPGE
ncbi:response regulator [Amycolatopsis saalfeldensis]|uniref:DNA-binding response regulator, NarL/FixJ family, contains REC and HTH domains n=1 Tax=Amycolatopsis saalfeldensis TaxID=394193 RepID=A0A1H8U930_9PSEU|nr:response regulator transcription factor [Amycolatopsis saalfeldensis]SEO99363.1 DNA-binding response regulator, NarL/FixJ family, contains REC and HTH domains [Amycolatopsis saalfeldensis]